MSDQNNTSRVEVKTVEHIPTENSSIKQYLSDTLGLRSYLQDLTNSSELALDSQSTKKLNLIDIFIQDLNGYNSDEHELLQKMLAAMKIDLNKIKAHDLKDFNPNTVQSVLFFQMVDVITQPENQTYSPRMLLKNLKLKNEAWTFLQKVMKQYQSLS